MRQRYLVAYDVSDAKRLRRVFGVMKGYGMHMQLSVFCCDLSEMSFAKMKAALQEVIDTRADQVLIIDVGPAEGRGAVVFESLGRAVVMPERGARIV